ncbi:MAG: hypothetical protein CVV27_01025 [Candidatus Melainabacteria bacterium HGW-Melainabacteria-1]|nr:MAG: hypothetical protein CVV27_01025 [Candidatus Melainabacteria bacterium HGW-Melainabacteria-1]
MASEPKESERIPWDDAFKQLMRETLTTLGLQVIEDPKLGKLPLKADLVIISQDKVAGEWRQHPLWQHLSEQNLLEFKSISDPMQPGDFEVLLAYTLLYRVKFKVGYDARLSSWLVVPSMNKHLKQALDHYGIELNELQPGFWSAKTLFPLYVIAYDKLPLELPYSALKLFIRSGKPVQEVFRAVLESEHRPEWVQAMLTTMDLIHPLDVKEVLEQMGLAAERQELHKKILELAKDDVEQIKRESKLEGKLEIARQMKLDGMSVASICKYTGLSTKDVEGL